MSEMLTYVGTKVVRAKPMTRLEYNNFRGWELPANENGDDDGYLVEYVDGGRGNVPQYAGYVSWSPKDVFERAYKLTFPANAEVEPDKAATQSSLELCEHLLNARTAVEVDTLRATHSQDWNLMHDLIAENVMRLRAFEAAVPEAEPT